MDLTLNSALSPPTPSIFPPPSPVLLFFFFFFIFQFTSFSDPMQECIQKSAALLSCSKESLLAGELISKRKIGKKKGKIKEGYHSGYKPGGRRKHWCFMFSINHKQPPQGFDSTARCNGIHGQHTAYDDITACTKQCCMVCPHLS